MLGLRRNDPMDAILFQVHVLYLDAEAQQQTRDEDGEAPDYEEKAQEIVQSILQEVVNTVAGGERSCSLT